jgi:hypothetical protein
MYLLPQRSERTPHSVSTCIGVERLNLKLIWRGEVRHDHMNTSGRLRADISDG